MQSEEFDNRTREAAEHHHPAYDEKAWEKMEKLLNKHLPQKKDDRKRIVFILLLLLLLSGVGYLLVTRLWKTGKPIVISANKREGDKPVAPVIGNHKDNNAKSTAEDVGKNEAPSGQKRGFIAKEKDETIIPAQHDPLSKARSTRTAAITRRPDKPGLMTVQKNVPAETNNKNLAVANKPVEKTVDTGLPGAVKDKEIISKKIVETLPAQKIPDPVLIADKKNKGGNKKTNPFFLTLSFGPDVSAVGTERLGRMKLMVGGGIGYTFHNKFTIRTGLYSSRKVYMAEPYQYDPPAYFWLVYSDLQKINADCKVLEIPLSLSYNFQSSARHSWFGTVGLSSYLMKRETYDYQYKDSWGQLENKKATIYNVNKHYFSVLTLSGGYQRNINKTFSVMAEPYLKIPLTGVGYGKVKLTGAGILFSLGIHPFHSSKEK